jgi:hypothetical protein
VQETKAPVRVPECGQEGPHALEAEAPYRSGVSLEVGEGFEACEGLFDSIRMHPYRPRELLALALTSPAERLRVGEKALIVGKGGDMRLEQLLASRTHLHD